MKVSGELHAICMWNGIGHWWDWWNCRKFHIVPAFRGFNLSGVNLAESWHSTMQVHYKMSLAVAAWKDVPANDTDHDYIAFVTNSAKVTGRGMNLMQKIAHERKTDQIFVNSALEALKSGDIEAEAMIDLDPEAGFIPTQKASHRVPQVYPVVNPTQKRCNTRPSGQQRKKRRDVDFVYEGDSSQEEAEADRQANMLQLMSIVPDNKEREKLIHNPPHLVFLTSMIEKCQGCSKKFTKKDHETPNDLIFKYLMFRK